MKKFLIAFSFVTLCAFATQAQDFRVGVHAGIDAANISLDNVSSGPLHFKSGLVGGVNFEAKLGKSLGVQLEGNYSRQGSSLIADGGNTGAQSFNLDYITVPLLLKINAAKGLSFMFGPQAGFMIKASVKQLAGASQGAEEFFKPISYYAVFGSEYQFPNGLSVGVRYNFGINKISEDNAGLGGMKSRYYNFRLGYSFSL
jgi:hypothetical protein